MRKKEGKQIYLLQHKFNQDWFYVGATKTRLYDLKAVKLANARRGTKKGPIYQAMQQDHATGNWDIIRLHDFTEHWERLEEDFIRWFDSYNNGLNGTMDGQSGPSIGAKVAAVANSKPVTNGIACYASAAEARKATGVAPSNITACCRGKRKTAGGFVWQYVL